MKPTPILMFQFYKVEFSTDDGGPYSTKPAKSYLFEHEQDAKRVANLPLAYYGGKGTYRRETSQSEPTEIVWESAHKWASDTLTFNQMMKYGLLNS